MAGTLNNGAMTAIDAELRDARRTIATLQLALTDATARNRELEALAVRLNQKIRDGLARADAATQQLTEVRRQWDRARQASEAARAGRIQAAQNAASATPSNRDVSP